jgi:DNA topoisomerase-3
MSSAKTMEQAKGVVVPDEVKPNSAATSAWIDSIRGTTGALQGHKTANPPKSTAPKPRASRKRSGRRQPKTFTAPSISVRQNSGTGTPLRIPYGNKEVALKLGACYGSEGWYAPPGVDLSAFGERGWL